MDAARELVRKIIKHDIRMEATALVHDLMNHKLLDLGPICNQDQYADYRWFFVGQWLFNELEYHGNQKIIKTPYGFLWAVKENLSSSDMETVAKSFAPSYPYKHAY